MKDVSFIFTLKPKELFGQLNSLFSKYRCFKIKHFISVLIPNEI